MSTCQCIISGHETYLYLPLAPLTRNKEKIRPELYSLEINFSLYILTHRISISVQALTPKLKPTPLLALASQL